MDVDCGKIDEGKNYSFKNFQVICIKKDFKKICNFKCKSRIKTDEDLLRQQVPFDGLRPYPILFLDRIDFDRVNALIRCELCIVYDEERMIILSLGTIVFGDFDEVLNSIQCSHQDGPRDI